MPIYNGDYEQAEGAPDNARKLKALMKVHSGIFIASPEYNASFSPLLKNAIDWVSHTRDEGEPPLEVEWDGSWYPAKVVKRTEQGRLRVHYIGYPESDDETVPAKRVRFPFVEPR